MREGDGGKETRRESGRGKNIGQKVTWKGKHEGKSGEKVQVR